MACIHFSSSSVATGVRISAAVTGLVSCVFFASVAMAAGASAPASAIQIRYEQERARCLNGTSNQDRATCLKEAGAARDEALKSKLDEKGADYKADAMARCSALTGAEAQDCRARAQGAGTSTGSVQSGGVFRETVTRDVRPASAATASAAH